MFSMQSQRLAQTPYGANHSIMAPLGWLMVSLILGVMLALGLFFPALAADGALSALQKMGPSGLGLGIEMGHGTTQQLTGLVYGVLVTACLYLLVIWTVMRDRSQIFLILLLLSIALNLGVTSNQEALSVMLASPTQAEFLRVASMLLFFVFSLLFTVYFLELDDFSENLSRLLKIAAGIFCLIMLMSALDSVLVGFFLPVLGLAAISLVLFAGNIALVRGVPGSLTHLVAFSIFLIGTLTQPMLDIGMLRTEFFTQNLFYFSSVIAAVIFAIVIAGQFAKRQDDKERALALSNERFRLATMGANEGLYDWDVEDGRVYFSDRLKRIIGKLLEDSPAGLRSWSRMILPADRPRVRKALIKFLRGEATSIGIEYRIVRPDHSRRWVYTTGVAVRDPRSRRALRIVGSVGDVTEKKMSEVALKASEARFRGIAEAHPVPVVIVRMADSILLYASPGAEGVFGVPLAALIGRSVDRFFAEADERKTLFDQLVLHKQVDLMELTLRRADGETMSSAVSARLIDYQGRPAAVIGVYDLSERKRAEEQIAKQQQQLIQSEKMAALGGLLAGVAHELNNPLSVVVGQSVLLKETSQDPKIIQRAEKIRAAAERCARIVKSFLAIARRKPPERSEVQVNEVIQGSLDLLAYQLKTDNVMLTLDLQTNLPRVFADGDQLNQVITNLVLNAKQAMQNQVGPRRITVTSRENRDTGMIMVRISDNGPGVPPEIRTRIFEPFFTTKPAGAGTGVGLSLCLNIIESHGGRISIHDTEGGGATFVLRLPVSQNSANVAETVTAASAQEALPKNTNSYRILLVDDEVELSQTLADILEPDGHITDQAENGQVALKKIEQNQYDLIISDLRMPILDGPGLYAAVCKHHPNYVSRMMFVTGDTLSENVRDFLSKNDVMVLDKPYMPIDVKRAIIALMSQANKAATASNL